MSRSRFTGWLPVLLLTVLPAHAVELCFAPEVPDFGPVDDSGRVTITADRADVSAEGNSQMDGGVVVQRGVQRLETEGASWDRASGRIVAVDGVRFIQPGLQVDARKLEFRPAEGEAELSGSHYILTGRPAQGGADRIRIRDTGRIAMDGVTYTTCPGDDPDWLLRIDRLRLYTDREVGEADGVTLRFMDAPIFYWPYLSFPLSDRRKSGFLVPEFGQSTRNGFEVRQPYYFNLAPNYDYLLTPAWMTKRSLQLGNEFRYLGEHSRGTVNLDYLPRDEATPDNDYRAWFNLAHVTRLDNGWRFTAAIEDVSDTDYFQDLGNSPAVTSRTHTERLLQADYTGEVWRVTARVQNWRTLDLEIPEDERPYARLPQVSAAALWRDGPLGLDWRLRTEAGSFSRDVGPEGGRVMMEPGISLPLEAQGFFLTPSASMRAVQYRLTDLNPGQERSPAYAAPILSVDSGLVMQRRSRGGRFAQTLEPRALYAYIPFRDQDDLPLFDSGRPDFNYVQLFRPNRYLGLDRLGDTNQLSLGMTSRLIDEGSGQEFLTASIGKVWFYKDPEVTLPGETPDDADSSPIVMELGLRTIGNWNANIGYQWDNNTSETKLTEFRAQYQPAPNRVVNFSYRYRPELLEDLAFSMGWPLSRRWSMVNAIEYSLRDKTAVDSLVGFQYDSCCWALRFSVNDQVSRRDGSTDTAWRLQLEFKGLGGAAARARYEDAILGYSAYGN